MKSLFDSCSYRCSKLVTKAYSTSFSLGIYLLDKSIRNPVYAIYGFVRFADEIVDTFHEFDKATLLKEFRQETYKAIENKISLNPILNSFQETVNRYEIDHDLIETFLKSMEMDLSKRDYSEQGIKEYILGSAEVVGLMCLKIFTHHEKGLYEKLKAPAMALGSAFQKVNFLRDLQADYEALGRTYFPNVDLNNLTYETKKRIENEILEEFNYAFRDGIKKLPITSRLGVYTAYIYYVQLLKKIMKTSPNEVLKTRIRVANGEKIGLLINCYIKHNLNLI